MLNEDEVYILEDELEKLEKILWDDTDAEPLHISPKFIYNLDPAPPKWELQEYIRAYCEEQNDLYLSWFLHYYEYTLNFKAEKYAQPYKLDRLFLDVKQSIVLGMYKALKNYDISQNIPFIFYKEPYVKREIREFFRQLKMGLTAQSIYEHSKLRKAMAIWEEHKRDYSAETIQHIAEEIKESPEETKLILLGGLRNERRESLYTSYSDTNGEESAEEIFSDPASETEKMYFRALLYDNLWEAYDSLEYRERIMLSQYLAFCPKCHSIYYIETDGNIRRKKKRKPMTYTDIATDHGLSSANTVRRICEGAVGKIKSSINYLH